MHYDYLWDMLRPLGVYSQNGWHHGELKAVGAGLDGAQRYLAECFRELQPGQAQEAGLEAAEELFPMLRAGDTESRRYALQVLFSMKASCFSKENLVATLGACGIPVTIAETGSFQCRITLTEWLVITRDPVFQMQVLERVLPCHMEIVVAIKYVDVRTGSLTEEQGTLSTLMARTQAEWETRLGRVT